MMDLVAVRRGYGTATGGGESVEVDKLAMFIDCRRLLEVGRVRQDRRVSMFRGYVVCCIWMTLLAR